MTTPGGTPAGDAVWTGTPQPGSYPETRTLGWFVRRSALWAGIVVAAVASACALYALASSFDSSAVRAAPQQDVPALKV